MKAEIRYLHHSGFAVSTAAETAMKTEGHFFIFDYYLDEPEGAGLKKGVIDPREIRDLDVVVFASHSHPDHYSPRIFGWRRGVKKIRYVLADEIRTPEEAIRINAGETLNLGDLTIRALDSTDIGVAFLVKADGLCIYHAGDLNWWHWEGEPEEDNRAMAEHYKEQIDLLRGEAVDIAFLPVDARLGSSYLLGLEYFMKTVGAKMVVPMHSFGDTEFYETLKMDPRARPYLDKIAFYRERGEVISYPVE